MTYRVVVTGHTAEGASVVLREEAVAETPGWMFNFWSTTGSPADNGPQGDAGGPGLRLAPPPDGSLFRIFHILPDARLAAISEADLAEISRMTGAAIGERTGERLWHRTETVDYVVLLSGRVTLHLDEGDIELGPQDVVVQRGTHHAWSNRTDEVAVAVCVMIGARPLGLTPPPVPPHRRAIGA
jgi:mannose-6-phosphate isomerase-like protein (cupin superfamily)